MNGIEEMRRGDNAVVVKGARGERLGERGMSGFGEMVGESSLGDHKTRFHLVIRWWLAALGLRCVFGGGFQHMGMVRVYVQSYAINALPTDRGRH